MPLRWLVGWRSGRAVCAAGLGILILVLAGGGCSREDPLSEIEALQDAGRFDDSIAPLRELLERDPDRAEAHTRLGLALLRTGQRSLAVWPLEKAVASPDQTDRKSVV